MSASYADPDNYHTIAGSISGPIIEGSLRGRLAASYHSRDGFGENTITGQPVSDKEILALRGNLGAYVSDALDIQFAFDWMDDQSGVRGARMLAPNRFAPGTAPRTILAVRIDTS